MEGANLEGANVYLIDHYTATVHNLSEAGYAFTSNKGTFHNRFTIQFEGEVILGTTDNAIDSIAIFPNPTDGQLNIVSPQEPITSIEVYDVRGRKLNDVIVNAQGNYIMDVSELETAVYFVTVTTESGSVTKRVVKK